MGGKLYLVTRADLRHGTQAAQLVHGMAAFARDYPETFLSWERGSNVVVCVAAPDEGALWELRERAMAMSEARASTSAGAMALSEFKEDDLDDQLTCVVLEPIDEFEQLCRGLPLACR